MFIAPVSYTTQKLLISHTKKAVGVLPTPTAFLYGKLAISALHNSIECF